MGSFDYIGLGHYNLASAQNMIAILHRYIAKTVILATLVVLLVVAGLSYFINLLGELRDIGVGDYGLMQAAMHSLLELPYHVYMFFPMLMLLGGLLGLSILGSNHELIVMRASGVPIRHIMYSVLSAAIFLTLGGMFVGEVIAPHMHYLANTHKSTETSGGQAVATASGLWIHENNSFVHIDRVMPHQHLEGVTRYQFDNQHRMTASYFVKTMDFQNGHWQLHDGVKTSLDIDHVNSQKLKDTTWDLAINPNLLNMGLIAPEEMPLNQIVIFTRHLVKNGLQASEFQFSFWKRVLLPLTVLVMLFLAIPFVFTAPRALNIGRQMALGILTGFVFYILSSLLGQVSVIYQLSPFLAALFPILLFAVFGVVLMRRVRD